MIATIHYLHRRPQVIGHFVRIGHTGHRQLEALYEAGRFRPARVVIEAARFDAQQDLVQVLSDDGCEIVLDTTVAELSSIGRFSGAPRTLPWANTERPLRPDDFKRTKKRDVVKAIAEYVAVRRIDTVLAPTHLVRGARDEWVVVDMSTCDLLREELDAAGAKGVSIDYPLIVPYKTLRDSAHRRAFVKELADLSFDNLWLRVSGFGADATAVGVRRYISSVADLHGLKKPIVADCVGGLASLAIVAFGAVGGIAHGVGEKERFDTRNWEVSRKNDGGGQSGRIYLPGVDRHFKARELDVIMHARGARRLLACRDRDCCALGFEDMIKDPKAHFLKQRQRQLRDLEKTPESRRVNRFIDHHLADADRAARQAAQLQVGDRSLKEALGKSSLRLDRMRVVLEDLDRTVGAKASRSLPITVRPSVDAREKRRRS